jgi:hypothetical protein
MVLKYVGYLHNHIHKAPDFFGISALDDAYANFRYVEAKGSWSKGISRKVASKNPFKKKGGHKLEDLSKTSNVVNKGKEK